MRDDHGGAPAARIDASVNVNPAGPPASLAPVFARARELAAVYPPIDAAPAREAWAAACGLPAAEVLVGNGASELIAATVRALAPGSVVVAEPCFSEYAEAAAATGTPLRAVPLSRAGHAWRTSLDALRPRAGDLVVLGHPNNPTGHLLDPEELRALAAAAPDARFLIDESFLPFHSRERDLTLLARRPANVVVTRSLTKAFCVPGLRLGLLFADPETIARVNAVRDPWAVNALAVEAAVVLAEEATAAPVAQAVPPTAGYLARARSWAAAEAPRATRALRELPSVRAYDTDAPYVLAELPSPLTAGALQAALAPHGIAIRDASGFAHLPAGAFRLGLRKPADNDEVLGAIAAFLACAGA